MSLDVHGQIHNGLRAQIDSKQVLFKESLLHHVVDEGHGIADSKRWVGQTKDSIEWS